MHAAWLVLSSGHIFEGRSIGADGETVGEIVFHTGLSGYQEIITDPSYSGQIVTFTCPHIGNVGVNPDDMESTRPFVQGLIMRDYCPAPSNWRATQPLHRYCKQHHIIALDGIDTRSVTRLLREHGALQAVISTTARDPQKLVARARELPSMLGQELVSGVTCAAAYVWSDGLSTTRDEGRPFATLTRTKDATATHKPHIVVYDFGAKHNIMRCLVEAGATVEVVPATTSAREVLARKPAGVLLSNGPGDPAAVDYAIANIRKLIGKVPLFGICLGHQLLALALGARTYKLPFGHHGANQPVRNEQTGRVEITSQNHGFAVDATTLPASAKITHINLNDHTLEGFCVKNDALMAIQYHPESSPGPHDSGYLFGEFLKNCHE